ncbi:MULTISPECIES: hypothetical protein [Legionella]|uniref:Uncharacterized protein n=1 Tax=Legionella resiliens TaxID=2905958 RepID=A0ABS8X367_9GAMM|nr:MULTISPECIES: hypothetical protein [unclassified Legionella]MCE0724045.1 hypothetical protein [Legionella sp. 9fVS26]MCE3533198.1 hypothetical protein [Legionella sp. 8cVS16]QLZ69378.1 hypothetical protein FOLKNPGA_02161 [Legionella sp. PC1000]
MKIFRGLLLLFSLIYQNAYAEKPLSPPSGQAPQCEQAYESSGQIKTINNVFSTLSSTCHSVGGMKLMHKILISEHSNEPTGVLFTCTGEDLNFVVFTCLFSTNIGSL